MAKTYFKVVRVVRRCYFNNAGTEIYLNIIVRNNGYLAVNDRQNKGFAYYIFISFVIRVNG